jgi:hypothetical protein
MDQAFGAGCADDAIEHDFGSDEAGCFGADIAGVVDLVAADGVPDLVWFGLQGS